MMPKWRTAHRVADWLWRHARLLVALALHIAATILFPVFALSLMPIATAPTLQAESYLARQAVSIETLVAAMLAYWAWLQLEAHRLVRPVLLARLRSRERRLFALALNLLFILAVATLARSPDAPEAARVLLLLDLLTLTLATRIHYSHLKAYFDTLLRVWQWLKARLEPVRQSAAQGVQQYLQRAAVLIAASKLWVGISEFLESPDPARGLLVLVGVMLLIALLRRPRTTPPPNDLAD
jgi:hypothetical protein